MMMEFGACPQCKLDISAERKMIKPMVCNHCGYTSPADELVKADLEKKVDVLKKIFEGRSRKIQTLFVLQSAIPKTSWLTRVKFEENKVSVEGYATSIDEAQGFAGLLSQEKNLFTEAKATNTVGEQVNGNNYFKFTLSLLFKD